MAENTSRTREMRLRETAKRQGLTLTKSRRRDPRAIDYGHWYLHRGDQQLLDAADLAAVEAFLTR